MGPWRIASLNRARHYKYNLGHWGGAVGALYLELVDVTDQVADVGPNGSSAASDAWAFRQIAALRLIEAACRLGSYSRAARETRVTHAAVSAAVARVEADMGQRLFDRDGHTMLPTKMALELADAYRVAENLIANAVSPRPTLNREDLIASVSPSLLMGALGDVLDRSGGRGGNFRVVAAVGEIDFRRCDAAIVQVAEHDSAFGYQPLWEERLIAVCTPRLVVRFLKENFSPIALPLLTSPGAPWRAWLLEAGVDAAPWELDELAVENEATALGLALASQGLALVDQVSIRNRIDSGELVAPFGASLATGRKVSVLWLKGGAKRSAIHRFADRIKSEFSN